MKRVAIAAAFGLTLLLVLAACSPGVTPTTFQVILNGDQESPPNGSAGFGTSNVTVVGTKMSIDGAWGGFAIGGAGAHVHGPAGPGENAGVLFGLAYDDEAGEFWGTFTLTTEELGYLLAGQLYINLHSAAYPDGEIRGQLQP